MGKLKRKSWYRTWKLLYFMLLSVAVIVVMAGLENYGKDWHRRNLPKTRQEVLNDPEFYKIRDTEKREILTELDTEFRNLKFSEQTAVIDQINRRPVPTQPATQKYTYTGYYAWSPTKALIYLLTAGAGCALLFEAIRRVFYYIVLGRFYPDGR